MSFSAILLVFKFLMFSFLQVCKFTDLQVHNSIDCPYFYGLSVKISDLLHLISITINKCIGDSSPVYLYCSKFAHISVLLGF